jgi:ubiquinone/menaquinone biosynthesis C-methylase UbiE
MNRFYESATSVFVRAYDAFFDHAPPQIAGDVAFYEHLAHATGGEVLELACGTGRIALPLAERGLDITGVDASDGMLAIAERKRAALPAAARQRLTLVAQDMSELALDRRFGCIFVAFRSFQHLLTVDLQRRMLSAMQRHMAADGRLALHLFDPRLDLLIDGNPRPPTLFGIDPTSQRRYVGEVLRTSFDHVAQIRRDLWRYTEFDVDGASLDEATREMALRWTWRWELHHLLELCGFVVEAEYSDFTGSAPAYGKELIVVARTAGL